MINSSQRLRPILASEFWMIGPRPDLREFSPTQPGSLAECVDHHVYRGLDGSWHLWGCIRGTAVGRILYHWEGRRPDHDLWRATGETLRADRSSGESLEDWEGQEWIQSPFVVRDSGIFYMFFGGHSTGLDRCGRKVAADDPNVECQICLMTSEDGREWKRYRNEQGYSRLFCGPGEARDPCVVRIEDTWHLYYAGYESGDPLRPGIYLRTSLDLLHWSSPSLVHRSPQFGAGRWTHECPHVIPHGEYFYLLRTEDYDRARTHVYRSSDPRDFGIDRAAAEKYTGLLPVAAPEVIVDEDGCEYLTSCHEMTGGIKICRLGWAAE